MKMNIYIGDGSKIKTRIRNQHCSGNVEGSSLRKHVAKNIGYNLSTTTREKGSAKTRLDLIDPSFGENHITEYMRSGKWKFVNCNPGPEAKDFQFFAIQKINPSTLLNINNGAWDIKNRDRYEELFKILIDCPPLSYDETKVIPNLPGVYLFLSDTEPKYFKK
jgi:hypothetical protein